MAVLDYSDAALNVRAAFFGASRMLYVEGEDDVIFWESILRAFQKSGFKVESVDGVEELKKKIKKIEARQIDSVAARDSDFTRLDPAYKVVQDVMVTYGHSIENSLVTSMALFQLAKIYGRIPDGKISEADFDEWLDDLENSFVDLIFYDAANQINEMGVGVLSDNCTRFMTSQQSCSPCTKKIEAAVVKHAADVPLQNNMLTVKAVFGKTRYRALDFMRGHFLATAAMKRVNRLVARNGASKTVNNDSFTSSLMMGFSNVFNHHHPHYEHYASQVAIL
ncbi:DUF4435 domain-containing protein [Pseudomonas sp. NPDC098740]|uniref:DUF4435 domain-containing protein n=1 Tax=Pseudomonas sp. NPDC098740 TaxID=3364486 RepID=UPI00383A8CF6